MVVRKEFSDSDKKNLGIFDIKCYTIHGAALCVWLVFLCDYIIPHIGVAL